MAAKPAAAQEESDAWRFSGEFDLLELRAGKGDELFIWDATFSLGNDTDQVMLTTSGGGALGNQIDEVDAKLLYGRTIGAATLLVGVRRDIKPHSDWHAAFGLQGTLGTRLDWETYLFVAETGQVTGEVQAIYDLPITQVLHLEPRVKIAWSAQEHLAEATRPGLAEAETALRLRYTLNERVNTYAGVVHERLLGGTRRLGRQQGDALDSTMALIGIGFNL
ncbi:copper resistance protein B [Sphingomonas sp. MG17]|uniref:Copper resistance protein B n=1 Tax=Sphingomonas tagetis TaxID=2949092 RepID=A0A9X2HJZ0_9SPHN|nr:copper resistance protein B [Sphingomonas tagetis]MCP3731492.1 copper resistance protein B [Sphingomonas tagetis]